jgi:hypothetical protein
MKTERAEVKSQSKVVGTAEYPIYEAIQEALTDVGEEKVLALINAQVRTNAMNQVRAEATAKPSSKRLMSIAMSEITPEEFAQVAGDPVAMNSLIESKMAEVKARFENGSDDDEASENDN